MEKDEIELIKTFIESQIDGVAANYLVIDLIEDWFDSFKRTKDSKCFKESNYKVGVVNLTDIYINAKLFFDNLKIYGIESEDELDLRDILTEEQINNLLDDTQ